MRRRPFGASGGASGRHDARATREISYASSAGSRGSRAFVRLVENATGRLGLIRRAEGYEREVAQGRDFWDVICDRYGIGLEVAGGSLEAIPAEGPLVIVANHPYGILDGLTMGRILSARRGGEFKVLAHSVFMRAPELEHVILPVDFDETREAVRRNLATRAEAHRFLGAGGAVAVFPGGTVSTAAGPFGRPLDPGWRHFTAKLIARSDAAVVPIFFEGHNSRLFQVASHLNYALRLGLMIREFRKRVDTPVRVVVGEPIPRAVLDPLRGDARAMTDVLRDATYGLSPRPLPARRLGHEFEVKHRREPFPPPKAAPARDLHHP